VALTEQGHDLAAAGFVFSLAMVIAVPGRIFWGWLGSGRVDPAVVMCWLALGMAGGTAAMALLGPSWPLPLIGAVATVLSATVMSWHGVLLSETARLAPARQRGAATGGVLSFGQMGGLLLPLAYSAQLLVTGRHGIGFAVSGLPALMVGIALLRARREEGRKR
jgi:fucose permease